MCAHMCVYVIAVCYSYKCLYISDNLSALVNESVGVCMHICVCVCVCVCLEYVFMLCIIYKWTM